MKITLELPDNTEAAFINYACWNGLQMNLVSKGIGINDLNAGYKDCREYEVTETMKKPDEIKKGLRHCSEDGCKGCNYKSDCDMADGFSVLAYDALAYIQQLDDHIRDLTKMMPKWISVEDEPKQTSDYLVYVWVAYPDGIAQMEMRKAIYNIVHKEWYVDCGRLEVVGKPTHWMPLPEPPKEE